MKKISLFLLPIILLFSINLYSQDPELSLEDKHSLYKIEEELISENYSRAIVLIDKAIYNGGISKKFYEKRAAAYYLTNKKKRAFLDIEEVVWEKDKDNRTYPLLSLYYAENNLDYNTIETLVDFYNKDDGAFLNSFSILDKRDSKTIINIIDSSINKKDYNIKLHGIRALINYSQKAYKDTYQDLVEAINKEQGNGLLNYLYGEIKLDNGEYISAIASYNAAINYGYRDIRAYKRRAIAKGFMDDFKGAIEDYNTIIFKNPKDFESYYLRGIAKNFIKEYTGAIDDFNKSISINDSFPSAYNYRGIVYINTGNYASALIDFYKALSLDSQHPFTHNNIGIALAKSGQSKSAESYFSDAIKLDPEHSDAYYNRGKLLFEKGNSRKAKSDLIKALKLNYENPDAHYYLALVFIEENKKSWKTLDKIICQELETASNMKHPKAQKLLEKLCEKIEP